MLLDGIKYKGNDIIRAYKNGSIIWNPVEYKFFNVSDTVLTLLGPKILPVNSTKNIEYLEDIKTLLGQNMKDIAKKSVIIDASNLKYSAITPGPLWCDKSWNLDSNMDLIPINFTNLVASLGENFLSQESFGAYFGGWMRADLSQAFYRNLIFSLICHTPARVRQSNILFSLKDINLKNLFSIYTSLSQSTFSDNVIKIVLDTDFRISESSNLKAVKEIFFDIKINQLADLAIKGYGNKIINFSVKDSLNIPFSEKLNGPVLLKNINLSVLFVPYSSVIKGISWLKTIIETNLRTSERANIKNLFVLECQNTSALFSSFTIEEYVSADILSKTRSIFYVESIQPLKQETSILFSSSASKISKSETYSTYIDYLLTTENQASLKQEKGIGNSINESLDFFCGLLPLSTSEPNEIHTNTPIELLGNQNLFNSFKKESFLFNTVNIYNFCKFGLNTNLVDFISNQKAKFIVDSCLSLNEEDFLQFIQGKNNTKFVFKNSLLFQNSISGFYDIYKIITFTNLLTHQTKILNNQKTYTFFTRNSLEDTNLLSIFLVELVYSIQSKNYLSKTSWKKAKTDWILTQFALKNRLDFTKIEGFLINKNHSIFITSFMDSALEHWLFLESQDISINNKTTMQLDKWEYPIETESPEGTDLFLSQVLSFSTIII